jgi:hypothetical protein
MVNNQDSELLILICHHIKNKKLTVGNTSEQVE